MYNLFFYKRHEINAVNLTSTKSPTPSREVVPTPSANTPGQQSPTNGGRGGKERKNRTHARADLIINLVITRILLILRQYKQNTMMSLTGCSSIKEK